MADNKGDNKPEKIKIEFEGKEMELSIDELTNIIKSKQELEKKLGEQGSELGELRKREEELTKKLMELEEKKAEGTEEEEDLFTDPIEKLKKEVEKIKEDIFKRQQEQQLQYEARLMELEFRTKHPDLTSEELTEIRKKIEKNPQLYASPAGLEVALNEIRSPQKEEELRKKVEEETRKKVFEELGIPYTEGATPKAQTGSEEPEEDKKVKEAILEAGKGFSSLKK